MASFLRIKFIGFMPNFEIIADNCLTFSASSKYFTTSIFLPEASRMI
jgi:hypothetical protein